MLRRQTLIALAIAVVLGLFAVYLANVFLSKSEKRVAATPMGTTKVAVALVPLDYGIEVTPDKVRYVDYPTASLPPGTFRTNADLLPMGKKRLALRPIQVNQPLLAADMTGEGQGASISALLPDGARATSVSINAVSGVAGFVKPNDSVDVLITRQGLGGDGAGQITDVLLQNIRVIAIDQDAKGTNPKPDVARTATLQVTPLEAQKLVLGQQLGSLSLVLRKPGADQDNPVVETVSLADLRYSAYGGVNYPRPMVNAAAPVAPVIIRLPRRAAAPAKPATNSVEVMRGLTASKYEVGGYGH
jgi:pilus assembly protein CpaB